MPLQKLSQNHLALTLFKWENAAAVPSQNSANFKGCIPRKNLGKDKFGTVGFRILFSTTYPKSAKILFGEFFLYANEVMHIQMDKMFFVMKGNSI